ncbi:MAG: NCS1 family nucleobase:cation symporter-1 [Verrucomicrobiia bacterium]
MEPTKEWEGGGVDPALWNRDLAPVGPGERRWGMWDMAALWVGMAICIPSYQLASGLIAGGMSWWQAVVTVFLGNLIVLVPLALNARAGTAYGIPFPVLLRASFGVYGANVPALMRAVVACGWFGIQTWIGGSAIHTILWVIWGEEGRVPEPLPMLGISAGQLGCFLLFWGMNMAVVIRGIECIRWLEKVGAPFLLMVGLGLVGWAVVAAGGLAPILEQAHGWREGEGFWPGFVPGLTAMVGFWATLSLNIPDFSRYARSQRDQVMGQLVGLPGTMALVALAGVLTTSATVLVYGEAIWDPVTLLGRLEHPWVIVPGLVALVVATLTTNIAANVVSPANDFSNVWPSRISFRVGGVLAGVVGVVMMPWKLVADPTGYIFTWLIGYSALLGPIGGIMIADYYVVRGQKLEVMGLYQRRGPYRFSGGFSLRALTALGLSIAPHVPGFLVTVGAVPEEMVGSFWRSLYHYSWFSGFALAFGLQVLLWRVGTRVR